MAIPEIPLTGLTDLGHISKSKLSYDEKKPKLLLISSDAGVVLPDLEAETISDAIIAGSLQVIKIREKMEGEGGDANTKTIGTTTLVNSYNDEKVMLWVYANQADTDVYRQVIENCKGGSCFIVGMDDAVKAIPVDGGYMGLPISNTEMGNQPLMGDPTDKPVYSCSIWFNTDQIRYQKNGYFFTEINFDRMDGLIDLTLEAVDGKVKVSRIGNYVAEGLTVAEFTVDGVAPATAVEGPAGHYLIAGTGVVAIAPAINTQSKLYYGLNTVEQ